MDTKVAWIVAGVFGVLVAGVIVKMTAFPSPSGPTYRTLAKGMLTLRNPEYPITHVLPSAPTGGGDAGDDYHQAIQAYKAREDAIEDICIKREALSAEEIKTLTDIQAHIAAGARREKMTYTFRLTPREIPIPYEAPEVDDFQDVANVCERLFQYHLRQGAAGYPKAERVMFDLFTVGRHMINERSRLDTVMRGLGLQQHVCERLVGLYSGARWNQPTKLRNVQEYADGLEPMAMVYSGHQKEVIWSGSHQTGKAKAIGDVFNLVNKHADPAVRAEATLVLGILKLNARTRGDKNYAARLIRKQLKSANPVEQAAARAADALDHEGLEKLWRGESE